MRNNGFLWERKLRLKRLQNYMLRNPLQAWLVSLLFVSVFNLSLFLLIPGAKNPGLCMLFIIWSLAAPMSHLIIRLSDERRREHPVPPQQESILGILSVSSAMGSIGALGVVAFGKRFGLVLSIGSEGWLLVTFSVSVLLALALGYAGRYSKAGRFGLGLSVGWLLFVIGLAMIGLTILR